MIRVCSGWNPDGSTQYGRRFLASFDRHWPKDVQLAVYVEKPETMPRDACRDLWSIPGADACRHHFANPLYQGRVPSKFWKPRDIAKGYSFRFDAAKFWKQILIPEDASLDMADGDILVWLDGDVETIRPIPADLIERQLGDADVCFLGREPKHSEIGFWAVRLSPEVRNFLAAIAETYFSKSVVHLDEWHSAFVWDHVRRLSGLRQRNLCGKGMTGHVFPRVEIGRYMRHDKGKRKPGGRA